MIPFGLPDGSLDAAEDVWDGREPDASYIRRILGLPEDEAPEP